MPLVVIFDKTSKQEILGKNVEVVTIFEVGRACKVVRIYAKSPYTDLPEKNHQKMVCISLKKSVFWLRGP